MKSPSMAITIYRPNQATVALLTKPPDPFRSTSLLVNNGACRFVLNSINLVTCQVFVSGGSQDDMIRRWGSIAPFSRPLLGGSWVVISGVMKSPNLGYNYSYPTYHPTYNDP